MAGKETPRKRPRIGLVLGAGSARGLAHIGVLQVFLEQKIPFDFIVGSSMGALVGALYAAGSDLYLLEKLTRHMNPNSLLDVRIPRMGFISGRKVQELIHLLTKGKRFEELSLPVAVVATDVRSGNRVVLNTGVVSEAVRASISIPGVFMPVERDGMLLVDGAVTDRLPIEVARDMGAERVIAVDVTFAEEKQPRVNNAIHVILASIEILERQIFTGLVKPRADILIQPRLGNIGSANFERAAECILAGREAALAKLPEIQAALVCGAQDKNTGEVV